MTDHTPDALPKVDCPLVGLDGQVPDRLRPRKNSYDVPGLGRVRVCSGCGLLLLAETFGLNCRPGKLRADCKKCSSAKSRARYAQNPEFHAAKARARRRSNPGRSRDADRKHYLRCLYGLSLADYDALLARQGGRCGVCRTDRPIGPGKRFHVDHDHASGKVRGLLCSRCNTALGLLKDSLTYISRLYHYLEHEGFDEQQPENDG